MRRTIDRLQAARREDRGFTLIELLIVIVILGVLAAIVVFSVRGITDTGEEAACEANEETARVAIEAYYAQEGSYPADLGVVVTYGLLEEDPSASNVGAETGVTYALAAPNYTLANGSAC